MVTLLPFTLRHTTAQSRLASDTWCWSVCVSKELLGQAGSSHRWFLWQTSHATQTHSVHQNLFTHYC